MIDPYNELDHQRPSAMSETEYVSQMLTKVRARPPSEGGGASCVWCGCVWVWVCVGGGSSGEGGYVAVTSPSLHRAVPWAASAGRDGVNGNGNGGGTAIAGGAEC